MSELRPLKRDRAYPSRFIVFDTEASAPDITDGIQTLRLGIAQYWTYAAGSGWQMRDEYLFRSPSDLSDYVDRHASARETLYLCAHNMSYDAQLIALPGLLCSAGWQTRRAILTDHVWIHALYRGRQRLVVFDTLQLLRASVSELGRRLGLPKGTLPDPDAPETDWIEYCRRDVDITARALIAHIERLRQMGAGGMALTLAGQAMLTYRRRYQPAPIPLSRDERVMALERDAYHGGRVECFRIGHYNSSRYYMLDVNSMYPCVMRDYAVPTACVSYMTDMQPSGLHELMRDWYVIADVSVEMDDPAVPVVHQGRLVWPVGRFRTQLHHPEIQMAWEHGRITACHRVACYRSGLLFSQYVDGLYSLKAQAENDGDAVGRAVAKLLLNGLYGKFGQYRITTTLIEHPAGDERPAPLWSRYTGVGPDGVECPITVTDAGLLVEQRAGPTPHTHWGIAGAVTSRARSVLWSYMLIAGLSNVLYVDTDSLIVTADGATRLSPYTDSVRLGRLKLERESDHVTIRAPKDYVFGGRSRLKGVPSSSVMVEDGIYRYVQFRGVRGWQRAGAQPGVCVRTVSKRMARTYTKGALLADGVVAPLRLGETGAESGQLEQ